MTQYTVQVGDSISKIALKYYGTYSPIGTWDPIKAIAAASGVSNPNLISPGQVLNIPDKPGTSTTGPTPAAVQSISSSSTTAAQAQATTTTTNNGNAPSTGSNVLKYGLISVIVGIAAFIGYKEYKKQKAKKKGA